MMFRFKISRNYEKILFLFVLALGLMSFSNPKNSINQPNYIQGYTCCSVNITYNGEPAGVVKSCMPGMDISAKKHACDSANEKATKLVAYNNENQVTP